MEENISYACQLLERAIELGSGSAAYRIGWMYERGLLSEEPEYQKAMEYYEKAVSMDNAAGTSTHVPHSYTHHYKDRSMLIHRHNMIHNKASLSPAIQWL